MEQAQLPEGPFVLLAIEAFAEHCTDPALPCTFLPGGARSPLGDGSFVDCTEIGTLFSCSSQILLIWIIQTDVKCFSKMENKQLCLFFSFLFLLCRGFAVVSAFGFWFFPLFRFFFFFFYLL